MKKHFNKTLEITEDDEKNFKISVSEADSCHICGIQYKSCDVRVRDHCHITGKYRGSAHQKCNINYKLTFHFIMEEIGKFKRKINVIQNNMERYISCILG